MYPFILIILIAELIIAGAIISLICIFDKKVLAYCTQLDNYKPQLKTNLDKIKEAVKTLIEKLEIICEFCKNRKEKIMISIMQNILIYMLLFLLKGKKKKYTSAVHLALALRDFWNNC